VLLVFGLVVSSIAFLAPRLIEELGQIYKGLPTGAQLQRTYIEAYGWYEATVPANLRSIIDSGAKQLRDQVSANLQGLLAGASVRLAGFVQHLVSLVTFLLGFTIMLFWLYQLWSAHLTGRRLLHSMPRQLRVDALNLFRLFHRSFASYLRSQIVLSLITGTMVWVALGGLNLLGFQIRDALLLAIFAGLAQFIPYIGSVIGALPAVLLVLIGPAHPLQHALIVFAVYQIVGAIEGYVLVPWITGAVLNIQPAVLTLLVIMFGTVFGVLGVVLAAPIAALARDWFLYIHRRLNGVTSRAAYRSLRQKPRPTKSQNSTRRGVRLPVATHASSHGLTDQET